MPVLRRVSTNCWPDELVQFICEGDTRAQLTAEVVCRISEVSEISTVRWSRNR